jgi:hypothetical protein
MKNTIIFCCLLAIFSNNCLAQSSTTKNKPKSKKIFANPLVAGQPISKFITASAEFQGSSKIWINEKTAPPLTHLNNTINNLLQFKFNANKNFIMKPKLYLKIGVSYTNSNLAIDLPNQNTTAKFLNETTLHNNSLYANAFIPLNAKNFILVNTNIEANGNNDAMLNFGAKNILLSASAFYGWKNGFKSMFAIGVSRTYRLGRLIHVPAVIYNASFSKKWGIDMALPATANLRYTPKANTNMFTIGYELEGTQYRIARNNPLNILNNTYLQRGEIRPKIGYEQKLNKYFWLSANIGYRFISRFNFADGYSSKNYEVHNNVKGAVFANINVHVVKINKRKKK